MILTKKIIVIGGCDNARQCQHRSAHHPINIYNKCFLIKCLNLNVFVNVFEAMKAYPMNEDNCKARVICSLHHFSHDLM